MRCGRRGVAVELLQRLRDSDYHGWRIGAQNAGEGARAFKRRNTRPNGDFDKLFSVAANGIAGRTGVFHRLDRIGDAAHGKAFNLCQHLILFIEDGDVEGLHFAAQRILAPAADMAEEPARKWAIESHPSVRQGKEEVAGAFVIFRQVQRSRCCHIEQCGMDTKAGKIRRKLLIQLNLGQRLPLADIQAPQRPPTRPEVELALPFGEALLVERQFALAAAGRNRSAIDLRRRTHRARRDDTSRAFQPLTAFSIALFSEDGEAKRSISVSSLLLAPELGAHLFRFIAREHDRHKEKHILELDGSPKRAARKGVGSQFQVRCPWNDCLAMLQLVFGQNPTLHGREPARVDGLCGRFKQMFFEPGMGEMPRVRPSRSRSTRPS